MKKFFLIALVVLILSAFVSCDKSHENQEKHEHQWKEEWAWDAIVDCEYHWHECADPDCTQVNQKELHQWETLDSGGQRCSVCNVTVGMSLESRINVTKEEWDDALNMKEFPSVIKQRLYYHDKPDGFIYCSIVEISENVVYEYDLDESLANKIFESCYVKDGDVYTLYTLSLADKKWRSEPSSEKSHNAPKLKFITIDEKGMAEFFLYEDFDLSIYDGTYICDEVKVDFNGEELSVCNIAFTFSDAKLVSYYFELVVDGVRICYDTTFSYDPSDVNIPQYSE